MLKKTGTAQFFALFVGGALVACAGGGSIGEEEETASLASGGSSSTTEFAAGSASRETMSVSTGERAAGGNTSTVSAGGRGRGTSGSGGRTAAGGTNSVESSGGSSITSGGGSSITSGGRPSVGGASGSTGSGGRNDSAPTVTSIKGVNLAGADFAENALPGVFQQDYTYPTADEVDYFVSKGMNVFRIPFRWERLQRELFAGFHAEELQRLTALVEHVIDQGAYALLDPHNYSRYHGDVIGESGSSVSTEAFEDFWTRLANQFGHERIIYGLMNEPYDMSTELWLTNANAAIAAIRETGASNLVLVPGNAWTGAHSWEQDWYGTPNGEVMLGVVDPADNFAYEVHQYMDDNSGGTQDNCVGPTIGSERLAEMTAWLRRHGHRAFLGEFAGGRSAGCATALDDMLTHLDDNEDVWLGWAYWAAGPWWGNSWYSIEPQNGADDSRMSILESHLD